MSKFRFSFVSRSSPQPRLAALCAILCLSALLCGAAASLQTAKAPGADAPALTVAGLESDARLQRRIDISKVDGRLDDLVAELAAQSKVHLSVVTGLSARKISCRFEHRPLVKFMWYLTHIVDVSWRRSGDGYQLFQTEEQIARENRLKRISEAREAGFIEGQRQALKNEITAAMLAPEASRGPMATFLSGCDAASIEFGLSSALEDEPFISATDQSHFLNHFCNVRPFSSLAPPQQQAVSAIARRTGYSELSGNSMVGLVAAAGSFRLGIASPAGGDLWVAPGGALGHAAVMSDQVRENDFDPSVESLLATERAFDLSALPAPKRRLGIPADKFAHYDRLGQILTNVSEVGGFDFLSDSYLNSSYSSYVQMVFPSGAANTVEPAIRAIGRAFAHRLVFRDGVLMASTLTPGLDLRLEPPTAVMNSLDAQALSGKFPDKADLLVMAECKRSQVALLHLRHPVMRKTHTGHIFMAFRIYRFLQLLNSLKPAQREKALSESGLSLYSMSTAQRDIYASLIVTGFRRRTPARLKLQKGRFYVLPAVFPAGVTPPRAALNFIVTDPDDASWCRIGPL